VVVGAIVVGVKIHARDALVPVDRVARHVSSPGSRPVGAVSSGSGFANISLSSSPRADAPMTRSTCAMSRFTFLYSTPSLNDLPAHVDGSRLPNCVARILPFMLLTINGRSLPLNRKTRQGSFP